MTDRKAAPRRNWSKSTLLLRLCETLAEEMGGDPAAYLAGTGLDKFTLADGIEVLKQAIVKEALAR